MTLDPAVRPDGACVVCAGRRGRLPKTVTQRSRVVLERELAGDPFCSSPCCRRWHGTQLGGDARSEGRVQDLEWTHT